MEHGGLIHPNGARMGQNLAMIDSTPFKNLSGNRAVYMWYNECVDPGYTFGRKKNPGTGHLTQVIWKGTTHVGASRIRAGNKSFVIANYLPAGNVISEYEANVPVPITGKWKEIMTKKMREDREFKLKYGDAGLTIRTTTSTNTSTFNGKTTVTTTVRTFHNDELVKITVDGVEQPLPQDGWDDCKWQKENYIEEDNLHDRQTPPIVGNPGIRKQLEPVTKNSSGKKPTTRTRRTGKSIRKKPSTQRRTGKNPTTQQRTGKKPTTQRRNGKKPPLTDALLI